MPVRFNPKLNGAAPAELTFHADDIERVRRYRALARTCGWKTKIEEESGRLVLMTVRNTPAGRESIRAYWKEGKFLKYTAIYKRAGKGQTIPSTKILLKLLERDVSRIGKGSKVTRKKVGRPAKTARRPAMIPWKPEAKDTEIISRVSGKKIVWSPPRLSDGFRTQELYREAIVFPSNRNIEIRRHGGVDGNRVLYFLDASSKQFRHVPVDNIRQVKG